MKYKIGTGNLFPLHFIKHRTKKTIALLLIDFQTNTGKSINQVSITYQVELIILKLNQINYLGLYYMSLDHVDLGPFQVFETKKHRSTIRKLDY